MKMYIGSILLVIFCFPVFCPTAQTVKEKKVDTEYRPRIINTTDLGADPDDERSMVRQLVTANEFDIEGPIVATGRWKKM